MMFVGSASALVTIDHTTTAVGPLEVLDTFNVDVLLTWDGNATGGTGFPEGGLTGIFTSTGWNSGQLSLLNAEIVLGPNTFETRPIPLNGGIYANNFTRLGTIAAGVSGDDLTSTARTVQYAQAANKALAPAQAAAGQLITTLTFQVTGAGDGIAEVEGFFNTGDTFVGDAGAFGSQVAIAINAIPEPGTALLMGLGLAGLAAAGRRND